MLSYFCMYVPHSGIHGRTHCGRAATLAVGRPSRVDRAGFLLSRARLDGCRTYALFRQQPSPHI